MKMKMSRGLFHLERNVLVFSSISHLYLIMKALSGCGKSGNYNNQLGTLFEPHDPFIHNCIAHFCFVIFIYDNMENLQYHTPLLTCFSSHISLHSIYKIIVYKICIISSQPKNNKGSFFLSFQKEQRLEVVSNQE